MNIAAMALKPSNSKKKRRGVFYTPETISEILCEWAVREKDDLVLEPSFGGCGFIQGLAKRFKNLGSPIPIRNIFGCDIDARAFSHLKKATDCKPTSQHFIKGDFLQLTRQDFGIDGFDAVVGNPPYVSYHNMFKVQRDVAVKAGKIEQFQLSRLASLWAYFVIHGCRFLKIGGRAAWVLPGSVLNSDYGKELLHGIEPFFKRLGIISLTQRLFLSAGTEESSEILLCEGWRQGPAPNGVEVRAAATVARCTKVISTWGSNRSWGASLNGRSMFALLPRDALRYYNQLLEHPNVVRFGDRAKVTIGIVTGCNRFFVVNAKVAGLHDLSDRMLSRIFSKFRFAPGLILTAADLKKCYENQERCLLVSKKSLARAAKPVRDYLNSFPKDLIETTATFGKRALWHLPDDGKIPDGFFPYMNHVGPRLVLNSVKVNSTNTVHRVYFNSSLTSRQKQLVAISMLTTFSQLSAEIEGRTYGAGVLKHEPNEAMSIRLFIPASISDSKLHEGLKELDALLRDQDFENTRVKADELIFGRTFLRTNANMFKSLSEALIRVRSRRY